MGSPQTDSVQCIELARWKLTWHIERDVQLSLLYSRRLHDRSDTNSLTQS